MLHLYIYAQTTKYHDSRKGSFCDFYTESMSTHNMKNNTIKVIYNESK